jgi:hypothetical protein
VPRTIDLIRASKLPSNMMQFAAKGALSVPPDENIEILVYLAKHNKIFSDLARMTLAGWDETASLAAASDAKTPREVLDYFISPDNLRPKLLPALLENPSVSDSELAKFAISASRESIDVMLQSARVRASVGVLDSLRSNPYLKAEGAAIVAKLLASTGPQAVPDYTTVSAAQSAGSPAGELIAGHKNESSDEGGEVPDETVVAYLTEHASDIIAEADKAFQPVGGMVDFHGLDSSSTEEVQETAAIGGTAKNPEEPHTISTAATAAKPAPVAAVKRPAPVLAKRENTMQKINGLDVKGRIQLALKGNKEERSILIRDGTKVVALAVLEAPKLADGEVEKFALQKNVLEAVLRQIPLKRRFMKNYIVVRNLVANPRTPLDLGLGLMKHLLVQDLKNISANKEVSETVRKLALKMYKQKLEAANKK